MSEKRDLIIGKKNQLGILEHDNALAQRKLGLDIYKHNQKTEDRKFRQNIDALNVLHEKEKDLNGLVSGIKSLKERQAEINEETRQLENQIKYLEHENSGHYEKIGSSAFAAYKSSALRGGEYGEVFRSLIELDGKVEDFEDRIRASKPESSKSGFFKKLGGGVSRIVLTTRKNISEGAMSRLFGKTGRELVEKDLLADISVRDVAVAAKPYLENNAAISAMKSEVDELKNEAGRIKEDLYKICGDSKSSSRIDELNDQIRKNGEDILAEFEKLGNLYVSSKSVKDLAISSSLEKLLADIPDRTKQISTLKAEIDKLEKEVRIDELNAEKQKQLYQIEINEQKISEAKDSISSIKKRIAEINSDTEELQKE